jgi:preprotein translocase subunit SecD
VAVLERDGAETAEDATAENRSTEDEITTPVPEPAAGKAEAADQSSTTAEADEPEEPAGAQPRRHTTPAPGSAAERAAARRARMRARGDGKGQR